MTFWGIWGHLRISWEPETWGPRVPFVHFHDFLRTFWTLWGILEDLRTWCSRNVEESFRNFWWLLVNLLRTWCPWGFQWLFRTLRILRTWLPTVDFEDVDKFFRTLKSPWIPFVDLWGLRGILGAFQEIEDILRIIWEPATWGPWVPFVHFLDILMILWTFWGLFEDLWTWGSQNIEEPFRNFWLLLVEHLRTVFRNFWGLCEDHLMTIWGTFDDHSILRTLTTFWGIEVALNTFCGPLRTSRALMTFWGIWGHFEDQLRTWGLKILGTFCAFSWLFEDFLDPLRNFGRPEDLIFSERWRILQELLMTSCEPIEDLVPLRISMTFQDIEDFANLITYWGLWGRW